MCENYWDANKTRKKLDKLFMKNKEFEVLSLETISWFFLWNIPISVRNVNCVCRQARDKFQQYVNAFKWNSKLAINSILAICFEYSKIVLEIAEIF